MKKILSSEVIKHSGVRFGTSGARGLVEQFSVDVCAAFTHAFISQVKESFSFQEVAIAIDNRPSSYAMAQACAAAIEQLDLKVRYYGVIPTPALAYTAMLDGMPSIMVTGSHIPFDRNGLKFYSPDGEIGKADESSILLAGIEFSSVDELPDLVIEKRAAENYVRRYTSLFDNDLLEGKRIGIYEHSSAGRDLYQGLFESLGADVFPLERTDEFVPIDTEAVADSDKLKATNWSTEYNLDCIFSTDGDGDRPLVSDEDGEWLRGDILGLLCSKALEIEALAVPVSCNTIISESIDFKEVSLTKIGSPYVIAEFSSLTARFSSIAGFEANGGYLLGSDINVGGKVLKALPTRDAVLPALMLLAYSKSSSIKSLVENLPKRFSYSDRIQNFATEKSLQILAKGIESPDELLEKLGLSNLTVTKCDNTDGLRLTLSDETIIHLRPSGNAPELRCYAEAHEFDIAHQLVVNTLSTLDPMSSLEIK